MPEMIQINFNNPFPLFPLAGVCLLPHTSIPLHVFEPRYIKIIDDMLDKAGQIAIALFQGDQWKEEYHGNPPIRPVVCLSQIERHEKLPMGRYNVLLQGICRAKIEQEHMPSEDRPYRIAKLSPIESNQPVVEPALVGWRERIRESLEDEAMERLRFQPEVLKLFERDEIPAQVLVEIVGHLLITSTDDAERRYRLLSEPDALERADYAEQQLQLLKELILSAEPQKDDWPKGLSWN